MRLVLRHLLAVVVLPTTVTMLIPFWIARQCDVEFKVGSTLSAILLQLMGVVLLGFGLVLFIASFRRFVSEGKGTLAPWDPPQEFVASGPYRFVRNPMISGVILFLFGEALVLMSAYHGVWAAGFLTLNLVYIPFVEEPQLERRFGESYREYCRHVRRFVPRLRPWSSAQ